MTTMWVVPPFDPGENRRTGFLARPEVSSIEHLALQAGEETLRESVVVRIADSPHRRSDSELVAALPEGHRGVLRSVLHSELCFATVS